MPNDFVVSGLIARWWQSFGAANGPFGQPTGSEEDVPGRNGSRQRFERGEIGWSPDHNMIVSVYRLRNKACFEWSTPLFDYDYFRYDVTYNGVGQGQANMQNRGSNQVWTKLQGFGEYAFTVKFCTAPTIGSDECKLGWTIPVRLQLGESSETPNPGGPQVNSVIAERWHELGAWAGPLGKPIFVDTDYPTLGIYQVFEHGSISTSPDHGERMVVAAYQRGRCIEVNWGGASTSSFNVYRVDVYFNNKKFLETLVHVLPGEWARSLTASGLFRFYPNYAEEDGVYGFVIYPSFTSNLHPVLAPNPDPSIKVDPVSSSPLDIANIVDFPFGHTPRVNVLFQFGDRNAKLDPPAIDGTPAHAYASHTVRVRSIVKHYLHITRMLNWPVGPANENNTVLLIAYLQAVSDDSESRVPGELPNRIIAHAMLRSMTQGHGQVGTSYDEELILGIKISRKGDYDMALKGLMVVAYRYRHLITKDQLDFILRGLVPKNLVGPHDPNIESYWILTEKVPETENHLLMINSTRYLVNQILLDQTDDQKYNNVLNGLMTWLLRYMHNIAKHDFLEFNSRPYQRLSLHALFNLHEFAKDPEIRTAAQIILDYVSVKFAVSSNRMRRISPFRRLHENMNRVCNERNDLLHDHGGDPLTGFFLMYLGPSDRNGNPTMWFPERWSFNALIAGLAAYRPPCEAYIISMTRPGPSQHRFYHGRRPEIHEADELADGGVEIYYNSPSFLLTAGGMFLNSGYGRDEFTGYKQVAYAQSTTLLPTRAQDVKDRPELNVKFEDLIRFDQYPSKHIPPCKFEQERSAVNTAVHKGFACGANLEIPEKWLLLTGTPVTGTPGAEGWYLLDLNQNLEDYGPLGLYVVAYRTPVANPEQLEVRYGVVPRNLGLLYVIEADRMPFEEFTRRILSRNTFPAKFEWGAFYDFHTADDQEHKFRFWLRPEDHKYTPRIYEVDGEQLTDFASLKLVDGEYLNAPNGHDGFIKVQLPSCRSPLVLDFRNPEKPLRQDNMIDCPQPWLDRAQALYIQAIQLIQAGRGGESVGLAKEAVQLYRQLAAISGADVMIIARYLLDLSSQLCNAAGLCAEAVGPVQAAVDVLRGFEPPPDKKKDYLELFSYALHILAVRLIQAGRGSEAVGPAREAVQLYRQLAAISGADVMIIARYLLDLSSQLCNAAGLCAEAVSPAQAAVDALRGFEPPPDKKKDYLELFAYVLYILAVRLQTAGRVNEAIEPAKEAVQLYRGLAEVDPDHFGPMLQNAEQLVASLT